jgi:membrane-bound inhibitor of C-type lysozyme
MTIENGQHTIRVTDASGTTVELPEVPESDGMRYAEGATAVVLEGQEALVMAGRHEPVACRR